MENRDSFSHIVRVIRRSFIRKRRNSRFERRRFSISSPEDIRANDELQRLKMDACKISPSDEKDLIVFDAIYLTKYVTLKIATYQKKYDRISLPKNINDCAGNANIKRIMRRRNVPYDHEIRRILWKELCKSLRMDDMKYIYNNNIPNGVIDSKGLPLYAEKLYLLNEDGVLALGKLMAVVKRFQLNEYPDVVTSSLCAIFLHYVSEDDAYALTARVLFSRLFSLPISTLLQRFSASRSLVDILQQHKLKIYNALVEMLGESSGEQELAYVLDDWKRWVFRLLPLQHLVRIIDSLLVEGPKVLIRIILAILCIWYEEKFLKGRTKLAEKDPVKRAKELRNEIGKLVSNCPKTPQELMKIAFRVRRLKSEKIIQLFKKYTDKISVIIEAESLTAVEIIDGGVVGLISKDLIADPFDSSIVSRKIASSLMSYLPRRFFAETPVRLFRSTVDGISFTTLWSKIDEACSTILIIKTSKEEVFGAYCSSSWYDRHRRSNKRFFGNNDSFIFKIDPSREAPIIYRWISNSNSDENPPTYFMCAASNFLSIGGGGGGNAIFIENDLDSGSTTAATTFNNPQLASERNFDIDEVEVFGVGGHRIY